MWVLSVQRYPVVWSKVEQVSLLNVVDLTYERSALNIWSGSKANVWIVPNTCEKVTHDNPALSRLRYTLYEIILAGPCLSKTILNSTSMFQTKYRGRFQIIITLVPCTGVCFTIIFHFVLNGVYPITGPNSRRSPISANPLPPSDDRVVLECCRKMSWTTFG
jgi:hypothetical protein